MNGARQILACCEPVIRGDAIYLPLVIGNERVVLTGRREMLLQVVNAIHRAVGKKHVRDANIDTYKAAFAQWDREHESRRALCDRLRLNYRGFTTWLAIRDERELEAACNPKVICLLSRTAEAA